jgi:hypothetical protein
MSWNFSHKKKFVYLCDGLWRILYLDQAARVYILANSLGLCDVLLYERGCFVIRLFLLEKVMCFIPCLIGSWNQRTRELLTFPKITSTR